MIAGGDGCGIYAHISSGVEAPFACANFLHMAWPTKARRRLDLTAVFRKGVKASVCRMRAYTMALPGFLSSLLLDRAAVPSLFTLCDFRRSLPHQALSISTSSGNTEPTFLPLHYFFNRTLSTLEIAFLAQTFLPSAFVIPAIIRSAGRAGFGCYSSVLKYVVERYNGQEGLSSLDGRYSL